MKNSNLVLKTARSQMLKSSALSRRPNVVFTRLQGWLQYRWWIDGQSTILDRTSYCTSPLEMNSLCSLSRLFFMWFSSPTARFMLLVPSVHVLYFHCAKHDGDPLDCLQLSLKHGQSADFWNGRMWSEPELYQMTLILAFEPRPKLFILVRVIHGRFGIATHNADACLLNVLLALISVSPALGINSSSEPLHSITHLDIVHDLGTLLIFQNLVGHTWCLE